MKSQSALKELAEITESQWGMVTSAQATARGISHVNLARFAESGELIRLAHGVYRDAGAPSGEHQELRAAWLSIEPRRLAWERLRDRPSFATVSGESAAVLHRVGDLRAMSNEFTTLKRKQTQRDDIRYRPRQLTSEDVTVEDGLPVTTLERTIVDLVEARTQYEHVGNALRDAVRKTDLDSDRLVRLLGPLAERNGQRKGDGEALLETILESAQIDQESLARRIAEMPNIGARIANDYLAMLPTIDTAALAEAIQPILKEMSTFSEPIRASLPRFAEVLAASIDTDALRKNIQAYFSSSTVTMSSIRVTNEMLKQIEVMSLARIADKRQVGSYSAMPDD